ncbi:MAG: type II toxin-antitoxin system VapC family toxin [Candidatus Microthrix parvicella]|jgi:predicted nucleic acid-binding protein|uniref:PIN domain-containing protein n=1 Tax=Candidatus Neomicrothrix parvicella RN1 TaxID=1229780 RepID=R4Z108_9ACTN|nr:nucleic acid-binding protein [Candidatus Microthrix sp.]MBK7323166.1 nucleic acid-binding protein [Candidatus Microthrix sp.]NLH66805.1 type II toxin-antitoxin system VapC family toxin [Candidatus Microthrix parvicella]CCM64403.1 conserved hypothetical protein [Candidatus Microthrix parvicella RN1]
MRWLRRADPRVDRSSVLIILDSGPLGLVSNPSAKGPAHDARTWARTRIDAGDRLIVAEVSDYEVRRELERSGKHAGIERLERLGTGLGYLPLSTAMMRIAASLWAEARNSGLPTARDAALDGDVILAAQAQALQAEEPGETIVVATTNVTHLERYVDARLWSDI